MDETNKRYNKNKAIGKNAEEIFEFLMSSMDGWEIVKYGVENHIEALKKSLKGDYSDIAKKIRCMPDFVVLNKKENKIMLFEVKRLGFIDKREENKLLFGFQKHLIDEYLQFWKEAKLFIVHQEEPFFYIVDFSDIDVKKHRYRHDFYIGEENSLLNKRPMNRWDFKDIQKGIKEVFPELNDETIKQASKLILKQEPEKSD